MSNAIPLAKPSLSEAERQAVLDVLQSPVLASGPRVEHFAKSIAELTERDCGIPCSSGTDWSHIGAGRPWHWSRRQGRGPRVRLCGHGQCRLVAGGHTSVCGLRPEDPQCGP